jgi:hypothetical protein
LRNSGSCWRHSGDVLGLAVPITPPALSAEPPFDAAIRACDASDVLADPFFKNRKPSPSSIIAIGPSDLRRGTDIPAKFEHPSPSKDRGVSCLYSHFKDLDVKPRDSAPIHINSLQQNCKSNACRSKSPGVSALFKKRSGVRVRGAPTTILHWPEITYLFWLR